MSSSINFLMKVVEAFPFAFIPIAFEMTVVNTFWAFKTFCELEMP